MTATRLEFLQPTTLDDAVAVKAERPEGMPIAGGTDVMVDLNFDRLSAELIIDVTRIAELHEVSMHDGLLRVGAAVPFARVLDEFADRLPGLAIAARAFGSPQIRSRATIAGNLASATPGDSHPVLLACHGEVEAVSLTRGSRRIGADAFFLGPKRHALEDDELIVATWWPIGSGRQQFAKIGKRNAMLTAATCSFAVAIDRDRKRIGTGIASAVPVPMRAVEAEAFLTAVFEEEGLWDSDKPLQPWALAQFGKLVSGAVQPIDDIRGSAEYRQHALGVLARRTLAWTRTGARG